MVSICSDTLMRLILCRCYCKTVIDTAVKNSNTLAYCANYGKRLGLATAAQIGTIVVIVIAGIMVKFTAMQASAVEGHHTKSEEAQSATTSIVLALFINTALTTTIANAYLPALQVQINKGGLSGILIQVRTTGAFLLSCSCRSVLAMLKCSNVTQWCAPFSSGHAAHCLQFKQIS